jgi:hypothetical protein
MIWQLVTNGTLPAAPLAAELDRYAAFSGDAARLLRILAKLTRAAACPTVVTSRQKPAKARKSADAGSQGCR